MKESLPKKELSPCIRFNELMELIEGRKGRNFTLTR